MEVCLQAALGSLDAAEDGAAAQRQVRLSRFLPFNPNVSEGALGFLQRMVLCSWPSDCIE
jgi:hypothetical protein